MSEEKLATLRIQVLPAEEDISQEEVETSSRELFQELKETDAEEVKLFRTGVVLPGAKGAEGIVPEIAVAVLAHFAPEIIELVRHWLKRNPARKVKITSTLSGKEVQVVISSKDLRTQDVDKIVGSLLSSFE